MGADFATFWSFWGSFFGRIFVHVWSPEAIAHEKCEHVIFGKSCTFSYDFQGPQRTENDQFSELLTSWNMPFFGQRFGPQHVDFGGYLGEPFSTKKRTRMMSEMTWKMKRQKGGFGARGGGADDARTSWGTLAPVVKRTFPQKMARLRGRDAQMAQASVYKPLKDRL